MSNVPVPRAPSAAAMIPWVAALVVGATAHLGWFLHSDAPECPPQVVMIPPPPATALAEPLPPRFRCIDEEHCIIDREALERLHPRLRSARRFAVEFQRRGESRVRQILVL